MNMQEYLEVKDLTYTQYCKYLQKKYGIGLDDYFTKSYYKKKKCTRTSEGLLAHHKKEDHAIMLSTKAFAMQYPFEWQLKENIVYCDYLEHLLLHILICKYPKSKKKDLWQVGIGGVINYITPELNDLYSGWETEQEWRQNCHNKVKDDKEVYLKLIEQFIDIEKNNPVLRASDLCKSFNDKYGLWNKKNNRELYKEIKAIWKKHRGILRLWT